MTQRTVEVEVTSTEEETVSVCDHCGLEATPEDSVSFVPIRADESLPNNTSAQLAKLSLAKDGVRAAAVDDRYEAIHFHTDGCLQEATLTEDETLAWNEYVGYESESPVTMVLNRVATITLAGAIVTAIALATLRLYLPLAAVCGFIAMVFYLTNQMAKQPAESLKPREMSD